MPHVSHRYKKPSTMSIQQCVPIHHPNIHCHTRNVCYIFVLTVHVLISQVKNLIIIIQTHVLWYFLCLSLSCMLFSSRKTSIYDFFFVFAWSHLCDTHKNIRKKRAFYDRDIYFWLSHKFLYSRNTKASLLLDTCTHSRDKSLWQHTPWSIQTSYIISIYVVLLWLFWDSDIQFCTPNPICILWHK